MALERLIRMNTCMNTCMIKGHLSDRRLEMFRKCLQSILVCAYLSTHLLCVTNVAKSSKSRGHVIFVLFYQLPGGGVSVPRPASEEAADLQCQTAHR